MPKRTHHVHSILGAWWCSHVSACHEKRVQRALAIVHEELEWARDVERMRSDEKAAERQGRIRLAQRDLRRRHVRDDFDPAAYRRKIVEG